MTDANNAEKVRVYALAKEAGLTSKEMLAHLQEQGLAVKSIQSTLTRAEADDAVASLGSSSGKKKSTKKTTAKKTTAKKTTAKKTTTKKAPAKKAATKKTTAKKTTKKTTTKKAAKAAEEEAEAPKKTTKKTTAKKTTAKKTTAKKASAKKAPAKKAPAKKEADGPWYEGLDAKGFAETYMSRALATFGLEGEVEVRDREGADPELHVQAEGIRGISGHKTIVNQLTYLLGKAVHYKYNEDVRYALRVEDPSQEVPGADGASTTLETLAVALAERMNSIGKVLQIDALNSQERRAIHTAIAETEGCEAQTISDGEGIFRRLMIAPASMAAPASSGGRDHGGDDRPPRDDRNNRGGGRRDNRGGGRDDRRPRR